MNNRSNGRVAVRVYRMAIRAFPRRIRRTYESEMVATFSTSHAAFRSQSPGRARSFAWRASLDAITAGARERWGRGGVGAPPPPGGRFGGNANAFSELASDVRFAARTLRRSPGFAATVVIVLALGVGINGALFSAINATLLAPMPYAEPDELVILDYTLAEDEPPGPPRAMAWSWPKYNVLADADLPLDAIAAYSTTSLTLTGSGDATRLQAEAITPGYFALLAVAPQLGRTLSTDTADEAGLEAILSSELWRERFGGDTEVIGSEIILNGHVVTVVGVAPPGFRGLTGEARLWVPVPSVATLVSPVRLRPQVHWLQAIGRRSNDAPLAQVDERMATVAASVDDIYPFGEDGMTVGGSATSMAEARRNPRAQRAVLVVAASAGLVLLIACVNLAALLLARGSDQAREIAVRLALGGSRGRVARGLITETLLLSAGGSVLGVAVATAAIRVVAAMWPAAYASGGWNLAFVDAAGFALNGTTLVFTLGLGLIAGLLFGVGPALRLTRADLGATLKDGSKATRNSGGWRLGGRRWLVTTEIAVALVLLVGASLMIGSLGRLLDVETGFNEERLLVFQYSLPRGSAYADNPAAFHQEFFGRVRALPGVEAAAGGLAPLRGYHWSIVDMSRAGDRTFGEGDPAAIGIQTVTDAYFETLQTPLLRGRTFDSRDRAGSAPVIVISESAEREFFGDVDPIGKPFALTYGPTADGTPAEVIGVVADVLYDTREKGIMAEAYFLQRQNPESDLQVMVRTRGEPFDPLPEIRALTASIDPNLAIYGITTADALAAAQVSDTRVVMQLLAAFAGMAVLLAAIGIWGVVSYSVVQRRRELGIRMALGARADQAVGLILRAGIVNAAVGVGIGAAAALGLTRYLGALLYEIDAADPATFVTGAALLFAVALLAAWLPARRAIQVDPAETLRSE
jgi:putative ABC transport system permease protein